MVVHIGYACISIYLRDIDVFSSRSLTIATLRKKGLDAARDLCIRNLVDLEIILKFNEMRGIRFFRITSNLFPHMENELVADMIKDYSIDFVSEHLKRIGDYAKQKNHRLSMHPGQYVQLSSPKPKVVEQSIRDLNLHASILSEMGLTPADNGSVLIIHAGGFFEDRPASLQRWETNFLTMPKLTRDYVVLENDERWDVMELLPLCERNNIPLCIDFFHHSINGEQKFNIFDEKLLDRVMNIWKIRGIKPKCHFSEQEPGKRIGSHSNIITAIPKDVLKFCKKYDSDIMLESKMKDINAINMYKKYFKMERGDKKDPYKVYWIQK